MPVSCIIAAALMLCGVAASAALVDANSTTLRDAARGCGVHIGSATNINYFRNASVNASYTRVFQAQYGLTTPEWECKWGPTEPEQGVFDFAACDALVGYAAAANAVVRGHNLCWGQDNPRWLVDAGRNWTRAELTHLLRQHITGVAGHYRNDSRIISWDVVNEAVSGTPGVIFKPVDPWYPAVPDYVDIAFRAARAADPTKLLFYNDYGGEGLGAKSDNIYEMVASMVNRSVPIDGVGFEMHVSLDWHPDADDVRRNMVRLGNLGLIVHVTEMDVRCTAPVPASELQKQAWVYRSMLEACLNATATHGPLKGQRVCRSFETWEFGDRFSWLLEFDNPHHVDEAPLPFGWQLGDKKPAFHALLRTLNDRC